MKKYLTALFLILLTAGAVFAWYCGGPMRRRYSAKEIQVSLAAHSAEKTARISIRWRDVHTTLLRKNGKWILEERGGRPASAVRINALLNSLNTLHPVKEVRNLSPEILRELRLIENDPKIIPGVRLTLFDAGGRGIFSMLLGKGHFVRSEPGLPPSPDAEGRYVLIGGNYRVLSVQENMSYSARLSDGTLEVMGNVEIAVERGASSYLEKSSHTLLLSGDGKQSVFRQTDFRGGERRKLNPLAGRSI